jgi:soluble lytic murein transglycosylase
LSNEKITPGKIIDWFGDEEPLSGYGKMILGESYILTGQIEQGKEIN